MVDPYAKDRNKNPYYIEIDGKQIYAKQHITKDIMIEVYAATESNKCIYATNKGVPYYAKYDSGFEMYATDEFYREFYAEMNGKEIYAKLRDGITESYALDGPKYEGSEYYALDKGKKYYAKNQFRNEYYAQTPDHRDIYFTDMKYASDKPPVNPLVNRLKPPPPMMNPPPYKPIVWPPPPPPMLNPPPYKPIVWSPPPPPPYKPIVIPPPYKSIIIPPLPKKKYNIFHYICLIFLFLIVLLVLLYFK